MNKLSEARTEDLAFSAHGYLMVSDFVYKKTPISEFGGEGEHNLEIVSFVSCVCARGLYVW